MVCRVCSWLSRVLNVNRAWHSIIIAVAQFNFYGILYKLFANIWPCLHDLILHCMAYRVNYGWQPHHDDMSIDHVLTTLLLTVKIVVTYAGLALFIWLDINNFTPWFVFLNKLNFTVLILGCKFFVIIESYYKKWTVLNPDSLNLSDGVVWSGFSSNFFFLFLFYHSSFFFCSSYKCTKIVPLWYFQSVLLCDCVSVSTFPIIPFVLQVSPLWRRGFNKLPVYVYIFPIHLQVT